MQRLTLLVALLALAACGAESDGPFVDEPFGDKPEDSAHHEKPIGQPWRSALFPADWKPVTEGGRSDGAGRYLPDYSMAGYHRGEVKPPIGSAQLPVRATVDAKRFGNGTTDATTAIQAAIDSACAAGGGVVLLPAGTFRLRLQSDTAKSMLKIGCSGLVLRGAGPANTRLLVDDPNRLRNKVVIAVAGASPFYDGASTQTYALAVDTPPTRTLTLAAAPNIAIGDWVLVRNTMTAGFRADHRMDRPAGLWPATTSKGGGLFYPRRVAAVSGTLVTVDSPTHYTLKTRDRARVYRIDPISEVGLESFAIGMVENTATWSRPESSSDNDHGAADTSTTGYQVHNSRAIHLENVRDAWIHDVDSFKPLANVHTHAHVLSNAIWLEQSAFRVTITNCNFRRPQYRGAGGNGYMFTVQGNDTLIVDSSAAGARHGLTVNEASSGNVFLRFKVVSSRYSDDTHRFLSHANLWDGIVLDGGWLQSVNRLTDSSGAGFTGTMNTFWNTFVQTNHVMASGCAVESAQFGHGYLIGSRRSAVARANLCTRAFTNSLYAGADRGLDAQGRADFAEGAERGDRLVPESLYNEQLRLRGVREGKSFPVW